MKIPENFEINTIKFLQYVKANEEFQKTLKEDICVYSNVISKIFKLPVKTINKKCYIEYDELIQICEEELKKLSTNKGK